MVCTFALGNVRRAGILLIAAAMPSGLSTPAAKAFFGNVQPLLLAGFLYLGSGVGVGLGVSVANTCPMHVRWPSTGRLLQLE